MKKSLEASEWILSLSLVLILASLFTISRLHEHRKKNQLSSAKSAIECPVDVFISGEVIKPGVFAVLPGTRIGDLVKKCRPKRFADLRGIDLDRPVEKSVELVIPKLSEISIQVDGAVTAPIELKVQAGSRICDLKSKIECNGDADLRFFKRKRLLKNGEKILVPHKEAGSSGRGSKRYKDQVPGNPNDVEEAEREERFSSAS